MQTNTLTDYKMRQLFKFISSLFAPSKNISHLEVIQGAAIKCNPHKKVKLDIEMGGIIPFADYIILKMR